jgi:hypothetical protein
MSNEENPRVTEVYQDWNSNPGPAKYIGEVIMSKTKTNLTRRTKQGALWPPNAVQDTKVGLPGVYRDSDRPLSSSARSSVTLWPTGRSTTQHISLVSVMLKTRSLSRYLRSTSRLPFLIFVHRRLVYHRQDRRLPRRLNWILPSSGLLGGVRWFETDVSGLPIGSIFKGEAVSCFKGQLDHWRRNG